jgi:hypothetical protein
MMEYWAIASLALHSKAYEHCQIVAKKKIKIPVISLARGLARLMEEVGRKRQSALRRFARALLPVQSASRPSGITCVALCSPLPV